MATQSQLVSYVLWRLRARGSGQVPMTEDSNDVAALVAPKLADLAARRVIYIGDPDDIPDAALEWVGRLLEQAVASAYGATEDGAAIRLSESMLRAQQAQDDYPAQQAEYF